MRMLSKNAPRRLTRRCISPAAANGAIRYAVTDEPITAATCHCRDCQYSRRRAPTRCCSRRDRSRCCAARGAPLPRRFGPRRHAQLLPGLWHAAIRRHRGRQLRRGPRRLARRPGSLPRAGQHVDRLGAVLAPHRCRRAQFSRQCATDSLRPTRYAAANNKGESCRTRPFFMPHQDCHGGQSIFAWLTAPLAPACPRRTGRRSRSAAGP